MLSTFRSISTEWNNTLKTKYCVIVLSSIQDVSPHPMCVETYNIMVSRHTHYTRLDVSSVTASNIRSARLILWRFIVVDSRGDKTMMSHGDRELDMYLVAHSYISLVTSAIASNRYILFCTWHLYVPPALLMFEQQVGSSANVCTFIS